MQRTNRNTRLAYCPDYNAFISLNTNLATDKELQVYKSGKIVMFNSGGQKGTI